MSYSFNNYIWYSPYELREMAGCDKVRSKEEKKICNCPNCGAPVSSYICEYCGTEFEKPKFEEAKIKDGLIVKGKISNNALTDQEKRESFAKFAREQQLAQMQASQLSQTPDILNTLNSYNINTQIMNLRDSINTSMNYQICSLHDQMYNASMQTNLYPANHDICKHIPINEDGDDENMDAPEATSKADEELAHFLWVCIICILIFLFFAIGVTVIYNLT